MKDAGEGQSRQNRRHAYPNPPPKHPISARLEHVRTRFDYPSKKSWHEALIADGEYSISYEAVRNYHYDREPPPSYLARVVEVFPDVRLEWLVTGRGEMLGSEESRRGQPYGALMERLQDRYEFLRPSNASTRHAFIDLLLRYQRQMPGGPWLEEVEGGTEMQMALADDLAFLVTLPLRGAWGFRSTHPFKGQPKGVDEEWEEFLSDEGPPPDYEAYFRLMAHVLMAIVKRERGGDSLASWPASLIPRMRRMANGEDPEPPEEELEEAKLVQERLGRFLHDLRGSAPSEPFEATTGRLETGP